MSVSFFALDFRKDAAEIFYASIGWHKNTRIHTGNTAHLQFGNLKRVSIAMVFW